MWGVPWVFDADRFIVAICILLSLKTVMLKIVNSFKHQSYGERVEDMENNSVFSKYHSNNTKIGNMSQVEGDHFVVNWKSWLSFLFKSFLLKVPCFSISLWDSSKEKAVNWFIHSWCRWIFWCCYQFMMRSNVLHVEVGIKHLWISECSTNLMNLLSSVQKFMADCGVNGSWLSVANDIKEERSWGLSNLPCAHKV